MADGDRLGVGNVQLPNFADDRLNVLKRSVEEILQRIDDNIDYLLRPSPTAITADYTAEDIDKVILADATSAAITVTLPEASTADGYSVTVKKTDSGSNNVTLDGFGSETIDGATTYALTAQYKYVTVYCDGTDWHIIANN